MTDQTETNPRAQRGTGFPVLALDDAVTAIRAAGQYGRSHTDAAFAGYLGHESTNSGPFRAKMASLRDWGLIERPKDGQVPMTELGHEIAHPTSDEERKLFQQAFFNAKPFAAIYEESAKGTDLSLELIANRAVTALGVGAPNKSRFAESFRRSVVFAGLGREGANGSIQLIPPGSEAPETPNAGEPKAESNGSPKTKSEAQDAPRSAGRERSFPAGGRAPILHQEWPVAGGRVVFEVDLDRPLAGTAFTGVASVITAMEKFVETLQPADAEPDARSDDVAAE